ncbi:MAG: type II toxin-antitoxin system RatA family toxin [Rhodocyclaceae bacterium]|nr:type II toxin-antitoxin system RatA family toxin [Rhodocyclaceae bacterium]
MASVEKSVLIERTPSEMFALVDGVEHYPEFLPWCGGTRLLERTDRVTSAAIRIRYKGIQAEFSTRNDKEVPLWMDIRLVEGPFRRLEGGWRFRPLGETACKIEFRLQYEFAGRVLEKALGPVFNHIEETFVESFVKRAAHIYDGKDRG